MAKVLGRLGSDSDLKLFVPQDELDPVASADVNVAMAGYVADRMQRLDLAIGEAGLLAVMLDDGRLVQSPYVIGHSATSQ